METKEMKIVPPDGYEIDRENSTLECIKFKPIDKKLTYEDVAKELFKDKVICYINAVGAVGKGKVEKEYVLYPNNCTSKEQAEKLIAINKLMNVVKYLNGDWSPDWEDNNNEFKYYINHYHKVINISYTSHYNSSNVYFKSEELARQAIEILGEETIKLALSTDW